MYARTCMYVCKNVCLCVSAGPTALDRVRRLVFHLIRDHLTRRWSRTRPHAAASLTASTASLILSCSLRSCTGRPLFGRRPFPLLLVFACACVYARSCTCA